MKRYAWVAALALFAVFVGMAGMAEMAAADSSHAQQDQAFLAQLAQPAPTCLDLSVTTPTVSRSCVGSFCNHDGDCASCPGGQSAWFCDGHRCTPF